MMRTGNLSESTASGKYASQRLHTIGPGGFYPAAAGCSLQRSTGPLPSRSRGLPPGRWWLLVETLQATDQVRGRPFGSRRPERLICSRRRRYIPATVPPVSNMLSRISLISGDYSARCCLCVVRRKFLIDSWLDVLPAVPTQQAKYVTC